MNKVNICVIGLGGVGGYFGGKLAHTFSSNSDSSANVFFVARGRHLEAIREKGLIVKSPEFGTITCTPTLATERISELPQIDVFLITVKGYDLTEASISMRDRVGEHTLILAPLNGADIQEKLRITVQGGIILPSCVYISSYIEKPGVIQTGKPGKIIFGKDPLHPDDTPYELFRLFQKSSIDYEWKEDANPAIWEKYIFIASFSLISAYYNRTLGEILEKPSLKKEVIAIMNEIKSIASKKKIQLPDEIVDLSVKKATLFPPDTQTSLQRDLSQKKDKSELDLFGGTILYLGKEVGISTPTTGKIYQELEKISSSLGTPEVSG
ncbi:MAG TPA: 2-dehydropantoate 2-reductase [Thermodesulfobacteriota bacterium]|nr:2-dehydropantoate 2-reductase [Thermodesulfobacteriota bacterium]